MFLKDKSHFIKDLFAIKNFYNLEPDLKQVMIAKWRADYLYVLSLSSVFVWLNFAWLMCNTIMLTHNPCAEVTRYSLRNAPINDKLVQCSIFSTHLLCPTIPKFTDLTCLVHQEPSPQKVAFIWAYMCSIYRVLSNHLLCLTVPIFIDLTCSIHQEPSRKKWLPYELICAAY